jgi:hypothetical protein
MAETFSSDGLGRLQKLHRCLAWARGVSTSEESSTKELQLAHALIEMTEAAIELERHKLAQEDKAIAMFGELQEISEVTQKMLKELEATRP